MKLANLELRKAKRAMDGPVRPTSMRHINARELLWHIRANSPCSRVDLARLTGLSAPTVSALVEHLEQRGLVSPVGVAASGGGRPPGLFALNPTGAYVAGCEISSSAIRLVIADLEGNRIAKWRSRLPTMETPAGVVDALGDGIDELLSRHSISPKKLLGICAAAPGITEADTGRVSAPHLKLWNDVPLKSLLEDRIQVHSIVENDVNLSALGEHVEGATQNENNFVFLFVGEGVGAGIFINGDLYRGRRGTAGEIGYMQVSGTERSTPLKYSTGSLEDIVGRRGIERAWAHVHSPKGTPKLKAEQILELAVSGNKEAADIVQTCAVILADVVANVSVLLDPSMIVMGGPIGSAAPIFSQVLDLHEKNDLARPSLVTSHLGEDGALIGAIKLALEHVEQTLLDFSVA